MSEPKFDASTPVWVEIVPTVMEFDVTPGAVLAAPAPVAVVMTTAVAKADPREHRRQPHLDSLPHSHVFPIHPSSGIPPGMPVTVLGGLHAHCSPLTGSYRLLGRE